MSNAFIRVHFDIWMLIVDKCALEDIGNIISVSKQWCHICCKTVVYRQAHLKSRIDNMSIIRNLSSEKKYLGTFVSEIIALVLSQMVRLDILDHIIVSCW
jgi:hypothetical protein